MSLKQRGSKGEVIHKNGCVSSHAMKDLTVGKQIHIHADPELSLTEWVSAACACSIRLLRSTTYKINPVMKADHLINAVLEGADSSNISCLQMYHGVTIVQAASLKSVQNTQSLNGDEIKAL